MTDNVAYTVILSFQNSLIDLLLHGLVKRAKAPEITADL